jgi:hypothetical protein
VKPGSGMAQPFGVFFPSLSRAIVGKAGVVSRVRCAAQKPRALDTTPTFPKHLLRGKRREGAANDNAGSFSRPIFNTLTPSSALAYCGQKMVLTMGTTLSDGLTVG